jgi:hypothetical protein
MQDPPREMTLSEILKEELDSVIAMTASLQLLKDQMDPLSKEYYVVQNDHVMLLQTAYYLTRRLQGSIPPYYLEPGRDPDSAST